MELLKIKKCQDEKNFEETKQLYCLECRKGPEPKLCDTCEAYANQDEVLFHDETFLWDMQSHIKRKPQIAALDENLNNLSFEKILLECDLTELQQEVIWLHFQEGRSFSQIAKTLKISRQRAQQVKVMSSFFSFGQIDARI